MKINTDWKHVEKIIEGLKKNDGNCPCSIDKKPCPCNDFYEDKKCVCRLFIPK